MLSCCHYIVVKQNAFGLGASCFVASEHLDANFKCPFALRSTKLTINCAYLSADDKHNYFDEFILFLKFNSKIVQLQFATTTTEKYSKNFFHILCRHFFFVNTKLFCSENLGTGEIMLICFMPFQRICTTSKMLVHSTHFNFAQLRCNKIMRTWYATIKCYVFVGITLLRVLNCFFFSVCLDKFIISTFFVLSMFY